MHTEGITEMAEELEELYKKIAALEARIEMLQYLLECAVCELPERAMLHVQDAALGEPGRAEKEARLRDRDDLRNRAAEFYDIGVSMANTVEQRLGDISSGGIVRTVQPYPIDPKLMRFPDLGY